MSWLFLCKDAYLEFINVNSHKVEFLSQAKNIFVHLLCFLIQNLRQIGPGVHELCSDVQTNKKKTREYYFIWKLKHKLVFHFIAEQYFLCCNALVNLKFSQTVHIGPHHPQKNLVLTPFVCQFNIQCFRCITSCTNCLQRLQSFLSFLHIVKNFFHQFVLFVLTCDPV